MKRFLILLIVCALIVSVGSLALAQGPDDFVFGDPLPDAPALARRGDYGVGVRTLELVNPDQLDIVNVSDETPDPRYDRPLTVEIWYPALIPDGAEEQIEYEDHLGLNGEPNRPLIPFTFMGRALRDADPDPGGGPYPLVIVSHGYPGSRFMLTYLTENLASKGYVVVAIDHTEATFTDAAGLVSTLYHRPFDILFVLKEMGKLGTAGSESFLAGLVDADHTALIGYSMGGYGALNAAGAGFTAMAVTLFNSMAGTDALKVRAAGSEEFLASQDDRIKAVVAFAPWGMNYNLWDAGGLAGLNVPLFFVAGSEDDVSGYETGTVKLFQGAVNAERYLLTYQGARHNVAPNPPPAAAYASGLDLDEWLRYDDSVWQETRVNNINQHFVTAFLGLYLKGDESFAPYLDLIEDASAGVFAVDEEGNFKDEHTYWLGFLPRTAVGLTLQHAAAGEVIE